METGFGRMRPKKIYFHCIISKNDCPDPATDPFSRFYYFTFYFPKQSPALAAIITVDLISDPQEHAHLISPVIEIVGGAMDSSSILLYLSYLFSKG